MPVNHDLLSRLRDQAGVLDRTGHWPVDPLRWLAEAEILSWVIPKAYGGMDVPKLQMIQGYEELSSACLNTAFILTQRNGACQRIADCENEQLKQDLLPSLALGESFATVGISHLTTSRQHLRTPAVQVQVEGNRFRLNGMVPWVTGAGHAQWIVTGGTCDDGRQVLLALPTDAEGVTVQPHADLMALTSSQTASVALHDVLLPETFLLAGPTPEVMKLGRGGGTGSQVTSTLALGVSSRLLALLQEQAVLRTDLSEMADRFESELSRLRNDLYRSVEETVADFEALAGTPPSAAEIRQRANSLVLRIAQAGMAVSKGAGYVQGHPVERSVREAVFFLVWSCPQPVISHLLDELTGL